MSRSKTLYQLQQFDSELDKSSRRILEIEQLIKDRDDLNKAINLQAEAKVVLNEKQKQQKLAENTVVDQNLKIDQNQKKLYSGAVTNHKELEDLQLESSSLQKYHSVLEERLLETMLETDQALSSFNKSTSLVEELTRTKTISDSILIEERLALEMNISETQKKKDIFLNKNEMPDLEVYQSLRKTLKGIAVSEMISNSCSSCGSSIPSAIAQEARSPKNLASCPTCKRILFAG